MESEARWQQVLDGQKLFLDYSYGLPMSGAGGGGTAPAQDWICTECQAVNFSRWVHRVHSSAHGALKASVCEMHPYILIWAHNVDVLACRVHSQLQCCLHCPAQLPSCVQRLMVQAHRLLPMQRRKRSKRSAGQR